MTSQDCGHGMSEIRMQERLLSNLCTENIAFLTLYNTYMAHFLPFHILVDYIMLIKNRTLCSSLSKSFGSLTLSCAIMQISVICDWNFQIMIIPLIFNGF